MPAHTGCDRISGQRHKNLDVSCVERMARPPFATKQLKAWFVFVLLKATDRAAIVEVLLRDKRREISYAKTFGSRQE
jgi:hypothetical protein